MVSRSSTTAPIPRWRSAPAVASPAGPAPITTTSLLSTPPRIWSADETPHGGGADCRDGPLLHREHPAPEGVQTGPRGAATADDQRPLRALADRALHDARVDPVV